MAVFTKVKNHQVSIKGVGVGSQPLAASRIKKGAGRNLRSFTLQGLVQSVPLAGGGLSVRPEPSHEWWWVPLHIFLNLSRSGPVFASKSVKFGANCSIIRPIWSLNGGKQSILSIK